MYATALNNRDKGDLPRQGKVANLLNNLQNTGWKNAPNDNLRKALERHGLSLYQDEGMWKVRPANPATQAPAGARQDSKLPQIGAIEVYNDYRQVLPDLPEQPPPGLRIAMDPQVVAPGSGLDVIVTTIDRTSTQPVPPSVQGLTFLADPGLEITGAVRDTLVKREGISEIDIAMADTVQEMFFDRQLALAATSFPPPPHHPDTMQWQPIPPAPAGPRNPIAPYAHPTTHTPPTTHHPPNRPHPPDRKHATRTTRTTRTTPTLSRDWLPPHVIQQRCRSCP
ncbi:hypothetical protein SUDANB145_05198 [Streptomyces sp. enrichment culture]|uniref:hypothetical protein n=1 Tax=Streptomyces sp. enrichment culture TaxID=1795815 RepID=UPI003F57B6AB